MQAPIPWNEAERISTLHGLTVLDTPPETDFDDIVRIASEICGAPISLVTLVDTHRQWFKAETGLAGITETPRAIAFCAHAIMGRDLIVIPDTTEDVRFADNPLVVAEHGVRFYAGAPLLTRKGTALGTLCVVGHAPHRLNLVQMRALRALAKHVTELLELRRLVVSSTFEGQPEPRSIDLAYFTEARICELRPIADARNIAITLGLTDVASVHADPCRLSWALDYVVFSALNVAPAGGRVAVRVLSAPVPTVEIGHVGGSIAPQWQADLDGTREADDLVPRAVAEILRSHHATVVSTNAAIGSPDVRFELRFPPH